MAWPLPRGARLLTTIVLAASALATGCGSAQSTPPPAAAANTTAAAKRADRAAQPARAAALTSWPVFGITPQRPNATTMSTGVTASNVKRLKRRTIALPGTVDSSPVAVDGMAIMTTTYGRTFAMSPSSGTIRWTFTPRGIAGWEGSAQITNASPAADASGKFVYTASPGGRIYKLSVADGMPAGGAWAAGVSVTRNPQREKLTSSLNVDGSDVVVTTGGYIGDAPPYQGHVVTIDGSSGKIAAVFNSLCSDRREIIVPSSCASSDSALWGRSGIVVEPGGKGLLIASGNGPFNGSTDWGDSVLRLTPHTLKLTATWTPRTVRQLETTDADLGSTSPAILGGGLYLQGGKDGLLHLLSESSLHAPSARLGGELANIASPGSQQVFTAPAVWRHGGNTTVFVATGGGTAAYAVRNRGLHALWATSHAGTSPVLAGGLLYVDDPTGGGLRVMLPGSGRLVTTLPAGAGHWQSPIVLDGRVVLPEGNANDHAKTGTLSLYSSP